MKREPLLSALCYVLWPIALIVLILDDRRARHDAINALGLWGAILLIGILVAAVSWIPFIGWLTGVAFIVAVVVFVVKSAIEAYEGKNVVIPYVSDFLKRNVKGF